MTDRDFILVIWRCCLEMLRAFGRKNGLCADIRVVKVDTPDNTGV